MKNFKCVVVGCCGEGKKTHRLPRDPEFRHRWLTWLSLDPLTPEKYQSGNVRVCDLHFEAKFIVPGTKRGLRLDAVPTLGAHPSSSGYSERSSAAISVGAVSNVGPVAGNALTSPADLSLEIQREVSPSGPVCSDLVKGLALVSTTIPSLELEEQPGCSHWGMDNKPSKSATIAVCTKAGRSFQGLTPSLQLVESEEAQGSESVTAIISSSSPVTFPAENRQQKRTERKILSIVKVARQSHLTPECKRLYKQVVKWNRKSAYLTRKCRGYKLRLQAANEFAKSKPFCNMMKYVNPLTYKFIMLQLRSQNLTKKARRFSLDEKLLALTLLKASGRGYRLLSKIFALPSRRTLTNLLNTLPLDAGLNPQMLQTLRLSVKKMRTSTERCCILLFDEIAISSDISYNQRADKFEGLEDLGNGVRKCALADYANVFMVKGVYRQWKQPVSFTFSSGPLKSVVLKNMIKNVISNLQATGLDVVATVCDQGSANRAAINCLLNESCKSSGRNFSFHVNGKEVVPLFDVPHLFKGIRNNLLVKDLHFVEDGVKKVASWDHILALYNLDARDLRTTPGKPFVRLCPRLTDSHVLPSKINKMKVSACTQVFSYQVGSLMQRVADWGVREETLPVTANDTADFILFIDELFDSLNGNSKVAPQSKPLRGGITEHSGHEDFWNNAVRLLATAQFYCKQKKCLIKTTPSINNLKLTLRNMNYLKTVLFRKGFEYVLPRAFNQDPLENFFGCIRGHGVQNTSPSVTHFISSFKALLVTNFMASHSPGANCEEDTTCGALDDLRCFVTGEGVAVVSPLDKPSDLSMNVEIPSGISTLRRSKVTRCTLTYISGYVAGKCMIKFGNDCEECKKLLTYSVNDDDTHFIKARQYHGARLVEPGSFLCFIVDRTVSKLLYLIPRLCNELHIKEVLHAVILKHVDFKPLTCTVHRELPNFIYSIIFRCIVFYWCRSVNKLLRGQDSKFVQHMRMFPGHPDIDPIKIQAHRRYLNKIKRK